MFDFIIIIMLYGFQFLSFFTSVSCSTVVHFQFSFFFQGSVSVFLSYFFPFLSMLCFLYFPLSVSSSFTFTFVTFGVRTSTSLSLFSLWFSILINSWSYFEKKRDFHFQDINKNLISKNYLIITSWIFCLTNQSLK